MPTRKVESVQALLDSGADVNIASKTGSSSPKAVLWLPPHQALVRVHKRKKQAAKLLVQGTPLMSAAGNGLEARLSAPLAYWATLKHQGNVQIARGAGAQEAQYG